MADYDYGAVYARKPTNVLRPQFFGFGGALTPLNRGYGRPAYTPPGAAAPNAAIISAPVTTQAPNILVANVAQKTGAPVAQVANAFAGSNAGSTVSDSGIHAPPVINGVQTTAVATEGDGSKGGFLLAQQANQQRLAGESAGSAFAPGGALYNEPNRAYPVGMARKIALKQAADAEEQA